MLKLVPLYHKLDSDNERALFLF